MAAGVTFKAKRKAGAFSGGDLTAGEIGVDTTNGELYFSVDGATVSAIPEVSGKRIIQDTGPIIYTPAAAQSLTTTHADVAGSSYTFTPVSASSKILYIFNFHLASSTTTALLVHAKLLNDGSLVPNTETTWFYPGNYSEAVVEFVAEIDSWGTSAHAIKMQARKYTGSMSSKVHETLEWDGGTTSKLRHAVLQIREYL